MVEATGYFIWSDKALSVTRWQLRDGQTGVRAPAWGTRINKEALTLVTDSDRDIIH